MEDKEFLKLLKDYKKASKRLYTEKSGAKSESSEREGYKTRFEEILKMFKVIEVEFRTRCNDKKARMPMFSDGRIAVKALKKMCKI